MDTLYLVMPAYNEEQSITGVVRAWYGAVESAGEESRLVVNCSGSTDGTHGILEELRAQYPRLVLLTGSKNTYGDKVLDLYRFAVKSGADYIFQTDSDGQTDPEDLDLFWRSRADFDVQLGHRSHRGDGALRAFVQKVETRLLGHYFRISIPDANVPFRLMKRFQLENYLEILPQNYPMPNLLLTALFVAGGEKVAFHEVRFGERCGGKNSMRLSAIFRIGLLSLPVFRTLGRRFSRGSDRDLFWTKLRYYGVRFSLLRFFDRYRPIEKRMEEDRFERLLEEKRFREGKERQVVDAAFFREKRLHPDLDDPKTFCEKVQWLKLYDATPLKTRLTDKLLAKEWIDRTLGGEYAVPLLRAWDDPEEIDFAQLPDEFVLKTNHSCRTNIIVRDKAACDRGEAVGLLKAWLRENYAFHAGCEMQYYSILPRVFAEKCLPPFLEGSDEYKFLCMDGEIAAIYDFEGTEVDGKWETTTTLYSEAWEKLDWVTDVDVATASASREAPPSLPKMIRLAKTLSRGFPFVRVDLYDVDGRIYVGELTFSPLSGFSHFTSLACDIALGRKITLPESKTRAVRDEMR